MPRGVPRLVSGWDRDRRLVYMRDYARRRYYAALGFKEALVADLEDWFLELHVRLVEDDRSAMVSRGQRFVRRTPAGEAWLADYLRYREEARRLEAAGCNWEQEISDHFRRLA